ncbi:MAG TPA: PLP-dependent aminotransferase family protein [Casimicrobiaceae bacterium]|nr:PLP-dependent aminotransferase family protein [Casimicrobiaceae bacterium]
MVSTPAKRSITFARANAVPLYRQIYHHFREAITVGQLRPGNRLPSVRRLAEEFGTARGTIDAAYAMLAGEGYILSRGPGGTIVSPQLNGSTIGRAAPKRLAEPTERRGISAPRPFQMGQPSLDAFPRKLWSRVVAHQARQLSPSDLAYPDPAGFGPLRDVIAGYLASSRGITCTSQQILITNGYQDALGLISDVLLHGDSKVWLEDPCYPLVRHALEDAGAKLVPIRVDAEGLRVADGVAHARRARLAVVTPSHQSPLGVALSLPRRLAMLSWASDTGAFIVEDDYDSEFRYVGRPLPALKSIDRNERVLYAGTFSKVLFPALRLGYLIVPHELAPIFIRANERRSFGAPTLGQRAVAAFMADGHFARHIKRMRSLYAGRRQALAEALSAVFGDRVELDLKPGGMHLIARIDSGASDVELARLAQIAGLAVEALSRRAITHECRPGLLLGFTNVAEGDALDLCDRLDRAIGSQLGHARSKVALRRRRAA